MAKGNPFGGGGFGADSAKDPPAGDSMMGDEKKPEDGTVESAVSDALASASGDASAFISSLESAGYEIVKKGGEAKAPKPEKKSLMDTRESALDKIFPE